MSLTPSEFKFEPIGHLESCYRDKFGVPRQSGLVPASTARLQIRSDLQPEAALQGLEGFSHLWLIWVFHENRRARYHAKVHPPRMGGDSIGVFATRSPHRPNPVGLSLVELVSIKGGCLLVRGADLMDGTPILDIKPYLPLTESLSQARTGWTGAATEPCLEVIWQADAMKELEAWKARLRGQGKELEASSLRDLIEQTIRQDPRPLLYRGDPRAENFQRRVNHAFRLYDGDVHFRMETGEQAQIFKILEMNDEFPVMNLHTFAASEHSAKTETLEGTHGNDDSRNERGQA